MSKIILDLCGGTGAWSKPYKDAGYEVHNVTLPKYDIRDFYLKPTDKIYGILAAPPCTHFSVSGAQYWPAKDMDDRTLTDLEIITRILMIIAQAQPTFWAIENPVGRLKRWLGQPRMYFNPYEFGDPYAKKTVLWGKFNEPIKNLVKPLKVPYSQTPIGRLGGSSERTKELRSITPAGFAKAFFEANK